MRQSESKIIEMHEKIKMTIITFHKRAMCDKLIVAPVVSTARD